MSSNIVTANQYVQKAEQALAESSFVINKGYLAQLKNCQVEPIFPRNTLNVNADVSLYKVERIVLDNKQSVLESLSAAYTALGIAGFSVFFYIDCDGETTTLYIGARGEPNKIQGSNAGSLLTETFQGHFGGSALNKLNGQEISGILEKIQNPINGQSAAASVTAVSGVPSLAVEEREHFMQGIERFIDAAEGRKYQAIILAEPVLKQDLEVIRMGYEQVATQLSPLLKQTASYNENQSEAVSDALGYNLSQSLGKSLSLTESRGETLTEGLSTTQGTTQSESTSQSSSVNKNGLWAALPIIGTLATTVLRRPISESESNSHSSTTGSSYSETKSLSTAQSKTNTEGVTDTTTETRGSSKTKTDTSTYGSGKTLTLEMVDKGIEQLLAKVDHQLERVEEANRYGGWNTAAYFIGDNFASSESLASIFLGLMRGQNSNTENFALTTWDASHNELNGVLRWLKNLSHPRLHADFLPSLDIGYLTPATLVSGQEMAVQLSLPRHSTSGTAVIKAQAFGRQVQNLDGYLKTSNAINSISLGSIHHLWRDTKQKVELDLNNLTSHMFITGSTGSGKSNTVYEILGQLQEHNIPFMIIEPAKGEYKHVFGNQDNVSVYGTNPKINHLLRINPFAFPENIHVLEHIDRLVEIFNVCWPMYAAMPAILKEAILDAYDGCGWSLEESINPIGFNIFPSFFDVLQSLEKVVQQSSFSEEVKSNYIGSLVTRVKSLTNGLNGQIFTHNEIDSATLFDKSCIVDLSRVGSSETKSLIMGILLVRLNEYRMSEGGMNLPLRHVTVLEEAHNILKATTASGQEGGASLESKSVEMITNSIAEMRTYGEGFMIIDQSPGAVDIAAIRNTNTKIVMRLPEESDRRAAGKSIGLDDEKLDELSKLPTGVALVNQNNWLEPVLCRINYFNSHETVYQFDASDASNRVSTQMFNLHVSRFLLRKYMAVVEKADLQVITQGLESINLPTNVRVSLLKNLQEYQETGKLSLWSDNKQMVNLLLQVLGSKLAVMTTIEKHLKSAVNPDNPFHLLSQNLVEVADNIVGSGASREVLDAVLGCYIQDYANKNLELGSMHHEWLKYCAERSIGGMV
ncbi:DUF87 domain-containing protein [Neisseriaceae bacterium CLB008]